MTSAEIMTLGTKCSEHPKGTKYLVQLGTPNEESSQKRLYTLSKKVVLSQKNNQSQCNKTVMEPGLNQKAHKAE